MGAELKSDAVHKKVSFKAKRSIRENFVTSEMSSCVYSSYIVFILSAHYSQSSETISQTDKFTGNFLRVSHERI